MEACPHGVFPTTKCNTGFANLDRKVHVVSCIGLFAGQPHQNLGQLNFCLASAFRHDTPAKP